jgi:hypothetical protein
MERSGGTAVNILFQLVRDAMPYGLVTAVRRRRAVARDQQQRAEMHEERHSRIRDLDHSPARRSSELIDPFQYESLIDFHVSRGLSRASVVEGSIPAASLSFIREVLRESVAQTPLHGLHIGNYVGVSLAYIAATLRSLHPDSRTVAIDPNLPHRGTVNPQSHVAALLRACGLHGDVILAAGYSGVKSVSNDGVIFDGYDPFANHDEEAGVENVLHSLSLLYPHRFGFAILDGNHDAGYLRTELDCVARLLTPKSLVVLDDVNDAWLEIKKVYRNLGDSRFEALSTDGRVGILRHISDANEC